MRWPGIESIYGPHLRETSVFSSDKLWEDLHTRVIEHVSDRLATLIQITLIPPTEYPYRRAVLHTHNTYSADRPVGPDTARNRRDTLPTRRLENHLGSRGQTSRHHQFPTSQIRRRRDERLELGHVTATWSDREDVDGRERCSSSASTSEGVIVIAIVVSCRLVYHGQPCKT